MKEDPNMVSKESSLSLVDYLPILAISVDLKSQTKKEVLKELVSILSAGHAINNPNKILEALLEREDLEKIVAALGISKKGIEFDALDGEPVHLFFLLVAPKDSAGLHLKILAKISRLLKDKFFRQALRESRSPEEVLKQIEQESEY